VETSRGSSRADSVPPRISVGIALATDPGATRNLLENFCQALAAATGLEVVGKGMWHYHRLLEAMEIGDVDLAWLPPIVALRAAGKRRVVPIALPVRNGVSVYSTALFTRQDSPIRTLDDLLYVRAAWVDRQSAAGYLVIRAFLRSQGVDLEKAFAADTFLGAHDAVARAVLEREADVGATFVYFGAPNMPPRSAGWGGATVRILAQAGPIPSDVIAASTRLHADVVAAVQQALINARHPDLAQAARALLGAESFSAPLHEHLEPLTALLSGLEDAGRPPHSLVPER
jgi:phosphate/phosphite/phosphonate ABC transporter binding protein